MADREAYLLVNFGGPRDLAEVYSFLEELLTDRDVIRTKLPVFLQRILFRRIAKKRAKAVLENYRLIGGKSPIFEDTEYLAKALSEILGKQVLTFHRYLQSTHEEFLSQMEDPSLKRVIVFPLFPQFSYATTGSIARWMNQHLKMEQLHKLRWVKSYSGHPLFIRSQVEAIEEFMQSRGLKKEEVFLLFSAHGLPLRFICSGDLYQEECERSFRLVMDQLKGYRGKLAYQSKFGKGEWLRPYTEETCRESLLWHEGRKEIVFVPIAFTTDHIETLFEVEQDYFPLIRANGLNPHRCPALGLKEKWVRSIPEIVASSDWLTAEMLIHWQERYPCSEDRSASCCIDRAQKQLHRRQEKDKCQAL